MTARGIAAVALAVAAVVTAVGIGGGPPAAAEETPTVVTTVAFRYVPGEVFLPEGGSLTLVNVDPDRHDVRADETDAGGVPLFSSAAVRAGETAPVVGVGDLEPGVYSFYCTIHTAMRGLLNVQSL